MTRRKAGLLIVHTRGGWIESGMNQKRKAKLVVVQTRVPNITAKLLRAEARARGMSLAAFLRALLSVGTQQISLMSTNRLGRK